MALRALKDYLNTAMSDGIISAPAEGIEYLARPLQEGAAECWPGAARRLPFGSRAQTASEGTGSLV